jgi:tetratricopeptide (TPR) repeat protein
MLEKEITQAFALGDFATAEAKLREVIPLDQENFVPWYNLACALSMQGKTDEAMQMLQQSIARGFADLRQLQSDAHMAKARETPAYQAIIAHWGEIVEKRTEKTIDNARKKFHVGAAGSAYTQSKDERLHLIYISAFDPVLFKEAQEDAAKLERWWRAVAGPGAEETTHGGSATKPTTGREGKDAAVIDTTPWVIVILPTRPDYIAWAQQRYGDRYDRVGGEYNHDAKMLVSMDLGSSWRHEFWHIMHWRDMDARGQRHPMWVMEGLCSLVEDCDTDAKGGMIPRPSWRTNMVRRLARAGHLIPFDLFFSTNHRQFMGDRTLAYYGQARAMFLYLFDRGHLRDWYQAYTKSYAQDPTGREALESVLGQPIKEIEKDFRAWARDLPEVPEEVGRGRANLPVDVGVGVGDGPVVEVDALAEFSQPGKRPTDAGGLRDRDVITAINSKPVRDLNDLARVLGEFDPGAIVTVAYMRGSGHAEAKVKLVGPRRG